MTHVVEGISAKSPVAQNGSAVMSFFIMKLLFLPLSSCRQQFVPCIYFARLRVNYVLVNFLVGVNRVNEFAI